MSKKSVSNKTLAKVYAKGSVEDKQAIYRDWASSYDEQVQSEFGYVGPARSVVEFTRWVANCHACILDAGCGTGLVGRALRDAGYDNLHGADFSAEMLDKARALDIYSSLAEADLTRPLVSGRKFDASISVGLFGVNVPGIESLHHIVDAVRADGISLITVNGHGWELNNWAKKLPAELESQSMVLLEQLEIEYLQVDGIYAKLLILQAAR